MYTEAPSRPRISVPELDVEDLQLEPASLGSLMATGKIQKAAAEMDTLVFNVFNSKFIGLLDVYFNGCGGWRFTEFKDFRNGQHIIEVDSTLPRIKSENITDLLQATGILVLRAHNKNKKMDDNVWQMSVRPVKYVDTRELAEKYNLLEES